MKYTAKFEPYLEHDRDLMIYGDHLVPKLEPAVVDYLSGRYPNCDPVLSTYKDPTWDENMIALTIDDDVDPITAYIVFSVGICEFGGREDYVDGPHDYTKSDLASLKDWGDACPGGERYNIVADMIWSGLLWMNDGAADLIEYCDQYNTDLLLNRYEGLHMPTYPEDAPDDFAPELDTTQVKALIIKQLDGRTDLPEMFCSEFLLNNPLVSDEWRDVLVEKILHYRDPPSDLSRAALSALNKIRDESVADYNSRCRHHMLRAVYECSAVSADMKDRVLIEMMRV